MARTTEPRGIDIPIAQLQPLNERKPLELSFNRLVASIRAVGLIEPLCVYKDGGHYMILDGYLRYLACIELGVETIPCLVYKTKEAYSFNKMVNRLSPIQETRMLRKSLEVLDEKTISRALGFGSLAGRMKTTLLSRLAPDVVKEWDAGHINKSCAVSLTFVKPERQIVILKDMAKAGDFTPAFARAMVIRTPVRLRAKFTQKCKNPWKQEDKKQELLKRLNEVEQRFDFYSALYRQYVADLLKLCVYIRKLVTNDAVCELLEKSHPDILKAFNAILFETGESTGSGASATTNVTQSSLTNPNQST
jgi:hypothetical protein